MRNTDVNMWYFDYGTQECKLTESCQKAHEMPGVVKLENFPDCLFEINYVREDCIELLRTKYEQLRLTGEKMLEEKYDAFGAYRRLAEKNTRASFRLNLTTGWIGDCVSSNEALRDIYPTDSADHFLDFLLERITTEEEAAQFRKTFMREQLLEAFSKDELY